MGELDLSAPVEERVPEQLLEELQRRATKDALSGLLNRETMERHIRDRLERMTEEETCALFIVDLDDFKRVNDTLGHRAGDQAIRQSARILSGLFRGSDIVGRLGGDEFAAFLCGRITEELVRERATAVCQRLQLALGDGEAVNVTASVGAHLAQRGESFEGLYQAADLALYKAKKSGKHRFCIKGRSGRPEEDGGPRAVNSIPLTGLLEEMDSGVALVEMGREPQVIYVSPSYCRIIGVEPGSFALPRPLTGLIHPDDLSNLERDLWTALESGTPAEHIHRVSVNGGQDWHWWHIRAVRVEYDNPNPVMLVTTMDVSRFKETEGRQREQIRRLRCALDQTSKRVWEVDLSTGMFRAYSRDGKYRPLGEEALRFPDGLVEGGWVHPNSAPRFRDFARELLGGRARGFGNFAIRSRDTGYYSWATVSYETLYDEAGGAARAVGVLEELPQGVGGGWDGWSPDRWQLPEGLLSSLIVRMRANLDLDTVEELWIEGSDLSGQVQETRCSQILQMERQKIFNQGERTDFLPYFDREQLLEQFRAGRRWLCAEYRRVDSSGSIRWVRHVLYLTEDPATGQVYLFVYLLWLDPSHQLERAIQRGNHRDPVTRLFDRETVRQAAEALFSGREGGNRAVAVLQVNGLGQHAGGARPTADQMRYDIAAALSLVLGGGCLLGQYSANQTVIVFPDVTEKESLRRWLEEGLAFLRRTLAPEPAFATLRFLAGVTLMPAATAVYHPMLSRAVRVCAFWWNAAADTVDFAPENGEWTWEQLSGQETEDRVSAHTTEMGRPLSEQEKDVALDCVTTMLTARTLDASLMGVLRTIGEYYRADRVYTMMLVEGGSAVVMTFEWTAAGRRSIQQAVSGTLLERFPLLKRCMEERTPLFLSRQAPIELDGEGTQTRPWYFTALPFIQGKQVEGFLCIENARQHPEDAALFSTLIPFMLQQRDRFRSGERPTGTMEQLMGLPDLRAYTQAVYAISSEYYTSLGVVCLDIPEFAAINSEHGFEQGSKMRWYVAKTLIDLFGSALLFRTWDAEFVIFYPNTTREVFLGRCSRLRSILQRRYPKQVRIGRAWAEGVFSGKRLANEAKAAMQMAFTQHGEEELLQPEDYSSVTEAAQAGRFAVYYQPKVDMRTGALVGAEALVRAVADDGSVATPARFIEFLEQDGSIRELDLFVLEQSMAQAERWRAAGLGVVPVSVNLSRVTLAHPSTLASILAVQSRFPDLPASALELEITERGNGIRNDELRNIVEQFRACGLHTSLDDFGSQYANLSLFTNVRFETVKLDRSLIAQLGSNSMNRALVRDLVQICNTYGMTCVAEGVETREQVSALLEIGCRYAQGFYYGRPVPAEEFEQSFLGGAGRAQSQEKEEHT